MEPQPGRTWDIGIGEMWIGDDGLVYYRITPGAEVTEREAKHLYDVAAYAAGSTPRAHVVDLRELAFVTRAARDTFAKGDARVPELATALIVKSGISSFLGNMTLRMSRLYHPIRLFTSETEAIEWARETAEQSGSTD